MDNHFSDRDKRPLLHNDDDSDDVEDIDDSDLFVDKFAWSENETGAESSIDALNSSCDGAEETRSTLDTLLDSALAEENFEDGKPIDTRINISPAVDSNNTNVKTPMSENLSEQKKNESNDESEGIPEVVDVFGRASSTYRSAWKSRQNYGRVYNLMNGSLVSTGYEGRSKGSIRSYNKVDYLKKLYDDDTIPIEADPETIPSPMEYLSTFQDAKSSDEWVMFWDDSRLVSLTTLDIQSNICAALNSRLVLNWNIGVDPDGKITGCVMSRLDRDVLRQAVDFSLGYEFFPVLEPSLVSLQFIPVIGSKEDRYCVQISVKHIVNTLYQLSSGRVFYHNHGRAELMDSLNEAYHMLSEKKRRAVLLEKINEKRLEFEKSLKDIKDESLLSSRISYSRLLFGITSSIAIIYAAKHLLSA